jgi:hypothetical protein
LVLEPVYDVYVVVDVTAKVFAYNLICGTYDEPEATVMPFTLFTVKKLFPAPSVTATSPYETVGNAVGAKEVPGAMITDWNALAEIVLAVGIPAVEGAKVGALVVDVHAPVVVLPPVIYTFPP